MLCSKIFSLQTVYSCKEARRDGAENTLKEGVQNTSDGDQFLMVYIEAARDRNDRCSLTRLSFLVGRIIE